MDKITILGLFLGLFGILFGMVLEGGHLGALLQIAAFLIVFGGTLGAVLVGTSREDLSRGLSLFSWAFTEPPELELETYQKALSQSADLARQETLLSLEKSISSMPSVFMQDLFRHITDGLNTNAIAESFTERIRLEEEELLSGVRIYSDAGGYAPTIGIIGAVLGLIHVMGNLTDTSQLGSGIAIAFVATVYGVASANLFFLPVGNKIKRRIQKRAQIQELVLMCALDISKGASPHLIREKIYALGKKNGVSTRVKAA